jgi:hypothetical protein
MWIEMCKCGLWCVNLDCDVENGSRWSANGSRWSENGSRWSEIELHLAIFWLQQQRWGGSERFRETPTLPIILPLCSDPRGNLWFRHFIRNSKPLPSESKYENILLKIDDWFHGEILRALRSFIRWSNRIEFTVKRSCCGICLFQRVWHGCFWTNPLSVLTMEWRWTTGGFRASRATALARWIKKSHRLSSNFTTFSISRTSLTKAQL